MTALSFERCVVLFAQLALSAVISACSFDTTPLASDCVPGRAEVCACDDGSLGASVCAETGVPSACSCAAPGSSGQGGGGAPPSAGSAGTGGIVGTGGSSGQGVASDDDDLEGVDAAGGAGDGAAPTDDGEVDASTDDMEDSAVVEAPEPKTGAMYGACHTDGTCDASLFCSLDVTGGGGAAFCSVFCSLSGFGGTCPAGPSGTPGTCIANVCTR